jgi:hypothetical protein
MANRLIWIPQMPVEMRYQEWWFTEFPKNLLKYFDEVIVLSGNGGKRNKCDVGDFAPYKESCIYEMQQVKQYLDLPLLENDVLLISDISYPGLFANALFHKKPRFCYGICHATSKNTLDYFSGIQGNTKWMAESSSSMLLDGIFVATEYHKNKLGWENIHVIGLPDMPFLPKKEVPKDIDIISVSRMHPQKVNQKWEDTLCNSLKTSIFRKEYHTWDEYYSFLSRSRILLITSCEETYGYQVVDALNCGVVVIAPNDYSYKELLEDKYLYSTYEEMEDLVKYYLTVHNLDTLSNKMQDKVDLFYENISKIMKRC